MPRGWRTCPRRPGCPNVIPPNARACPDCSRAAEQQRGTAAQRGYGKQWRAIRRAYLRKPEHSRCVLCGAPSEVPDHYPRSRRELVDAGVPNPDAAQYLRPLCRPCHSLETTRHQPGGWARR